MNPFYSKVYLKYEEIWKTCAQDLNGRRDYFRDTFGAEGSRKGDLVKFAADREYTGYSMDLLRFEVNRNEHVAATETIDTRWLGDPDLRRVPAGVQYTARQKKTISYMTRLEGHWWDKGHVLDMGSDPGAGAKGVMIGLIHNAPCRNIGPELKATIIVDHNTASWETQLDKFSNPILKWIVLKRPTDLRKLAFAAEADVVVVTPRFMAAHYARFRDGPVWHRYVYCGEIGFPIEARNIWNMTPIITGTEPVRLRHTIYAMPFQCKETDFICRLPAVTHVKNVEELTDHVTGYMDDIHSTECCICYGPSDSVYAKCGHVLCYDCMVQVHACPKCRQAYDHEPDIITTSEPKYIFPLADVLRKVIPAEGSVVVISHLAHRLSEILGPLYGQRVKFRFFDVGDDLEVGTVISAVDYHSLLAKVAHAGRGEGLFCVQLVLG